MKILNKFGIIPKNEQLYRMAFIHNSYANENNVTSYERLEFLGDAALDFVISEYLYNNYQLSEGEMTKMRASYVCESALYNYSIHLGLNNYLQLGKGEQSNGGKFRKPIVADVFESFVGAIFLDQGFEVTKQFILEVIIPFINNEADVFFEDYKSMLQEVVQSDQKYLEYEVVKETGPSHDKSFTIVVKVDGITLGKGTSKSKKEAEQLAAKDALEKKVEIN